MRRWEAFAVDGDAVYARNRTGELEIITADGVTEPVSEGQLLAVNSTASPNGSPVSLQVGSGGTGVGTAAAEEEAKRRGLGGWWGGLSTAAKVSLGLLSTAALYGIYDQVIRDDDSGAGVDDQGVDSPS